MNSEDSQHNRKYLRLPPSATQPISAAILQGGEEIESSRIRIIDIGLGGLGLEVPEGTFLKQGIYIERIELSLPGEESCITSGTVAFLRGRKCGITFAETHESEFGKIARYIYKREIELLNILDNTRFVPDPDNPAQAFVQYEGHSERPSEVRLINIGMGGVCIEIPDENPLLQPGLIENITILLPDEEPCLMSVKVSEQNGGRFDLEFILKKKSELYKIARYCHMIEMIRAREEVAEKEPADVVAAATNRKTILIVDDSATIQEEYSKFLFECGYIVLQAKDGMEGIKLAAEVLPDLILMDLNMPALDGIQSTRIIKSLPNTKHIPIFMLTMESEKGAVVKAIQVGAKDYIIKSMSKDFVLKRIGDFFSSGVQRKQA